MMTLPQAIRRFGMSCACVGVLAASASTLAQDNRDETIRAMQEAAERARQVPITPADTPESETTGEQSPSLVAPPRPAVLMREGAYLTDEPGRLHKDPVGGFWVFTLERTATGTDTHPTFIILPCTRLNQMQRTVETSDLDIVFAITGRVYVYANRNYLLPLMAPTLERYEERAIEPPAPTEQPAEATQDDIDLNNISADELINRVRDEVPLPRSTGNDTPASTTEEQSATVSADPEAAQLEGELIVRRRGRMLRNPDGGWRFVFDADASGQADPPVQLLPCLLLERMRDDALNRAGFDAMLLTGQVYTYRGRTFVMPTMYSVERSRNNIR